MRRSFLALTTLVAALVLPATASAVTVSKAQLTGGQLRVEGSNAAPGIFITAESTTSSAGIRSDTRGAFKIQANGFSAPDCTIVVSDRQTPSATVRIGGCTPTVKPVSSPAPAPSGSCQLVAPTGPTNFTRNTNSTLYFTTTGCSTASFGDLRFAITGGSIPVGMSGPNLQGADAANIIGTPTLAGTYVFQVQVTDRLGQTDFENYTINVASSATRLSATVRCAARDGLRRGAYGATPVVRNRPETPSTRPASPLPQSAGSSASAARRGLRRR